jgi:hypothetical protein
LQCNLDSKIGIGGRRMIKHLTKPIRAIHFIFLAFLMTLSAK